MIIFAERHGILHFRAALHFLFPLKRLRPARTDQRIDIGLGARVKCGEDVITVVPLRCEDPEIGGRIIYFLILELLQHAEHAAVLHIMAIDDRIDI